MELTEDSINIIFGAGSFWEVLFVDGVDKVGQS